MICLEELAGEINGEGGKVKSDAAENGHLDGLARLNLTSLDLLLGELFLAWSEHFVM